MDLPLELEGPSSKQQMEVTTGRSLQAATEDDLYGVAFTDSNIGTVVGNFGAILRTTDAGSHWTIQREGITDVLFGVSFTDANNGTAVGSDGLILRTTNGGTNWIQQTSGTTSFLNDVSFTDTNNGTAVGDNGTILRTTNGGTTLGSSNKRHNKQP